MKRFLLLLVFSIVASSQTTPVLNLSLNPTSVPPGGQSVLTINFADTAVTSNIAGLQWSLIPPSSALPGTYTLGASASTAQKVMSTGGAGIAMVVGSDNTPSGQPPINNTAMATGPVATIPLTIPNGTIPGAVSVTLSGLVAVSATGASVPITSSAVVLTVLRSKYDLNGDGLVNAADVSVAISQVFGVCTTADVTGGANGAPDGKCDLLDVSAVILAALNIIPH